jgi:hypothetical protein
MQKEIRNGINDIGEKIKSCTDDELIELGQGIYDFLTLVYNSYKAYFKPKKSQRVIGNEFNNLFLQGESVYSTGLEYGWLEEGMEFVDDNFPKYLPYHAKVGIAGHANRINIEEEFLLRDAFYMLCMAEKVYQDMYKEYYKYKESKRDIETYKEHNKFTDYNQSVATYSRLGIISFYSFAEAFVNSIGYDFYLRNKINLSANEIEHAYYKPLFFC